jgi:hypothetical protein
MPSIDSLYRPSDSQRLAAAANHAVKIAAYGTDRPKLTILCIHDVMMLPLSMYLDSGWRSEGGLMLIWQTIKSIFTSRVPTYAPPIQHDKPERPLPIFHPPEPVLPWGERQGFGFKFSDDIIRRIADWERRIEPEIVEHQRQLFTKRIVTKPILGDAPGHHVLEITALDPDDWMLKLELYPGR